MSEAPSAGYSAKEVAAILGMKLRSVYLYAKELRARKGADGQLVFDAYTVREVKEGRMPLRNGDHAHGALAGKVASLVFQELLAGKTTVAIVIEHDLLPEHVEKLADMFHRMSGALLVTGSQLRALYTHPSFMGVSPCPTSEALVTGLLESLGGESAEMCARCGKRPRLLCRGCQPLAEEGVKRGNGVRRRA